MQFSKTRLDGLPLTSGGAICSLLVDGVLETIHQEVIIYRLLIVGAYRDLIDAESFIFTYGSFGGFNRGTHYFRRLLARCRIAFNACKTAFLRSLR
jgi:hypothetical protein